MNMNKAFLLMSLASDTGSIAICIRKIDRDVCVFYTGGFVAHFIRLMDSQPLICGIDNPDASKKARANARGHSPKIGPVWK